MGLKGRRLVMTNVGINCRWKKKCLVFISVRFWPKTFNGRLPSNLKLVLHWNFSLNILIPVLHIQISHINGLTLLGDLTMDFPVSRMSGNPVQWHRTFHRETQVYQLLCTGVWIHAFVVHPIQSGFGAI